MNKINKIENSAMMKNSHPHKKNKTKLSLKEANPIETKTNHNIFITPTKKWSRIDKKFKLNKTIIKEKIAMTIILVKMKF